MARNLFNKSIVSSLIVAAATSALARTTPVESVTLPETARPVATTPVNETTLSTLTGMQTIVVSPEQLIKYGAKPQHVATDISFAPTAQQRTAQQKAALNKQATDISKAMRKLIAAKNPDLAQHIDKDYSPGTYDSFTWRWLNGMQGQLMDVGANKKVCVVFDRGDNTIGFALGSMIGEAVPRIGENPELRTLGLLRAAEACLRPTMVEIGKADGGGTAVTPQEAEVAAIKIAPQYGVSQQTLDQHASLTAVASLLTKRAELYAPVYEKDTGIQVRTPEEFSKVSGALDAASEYLQSGKLPPQATPQERLVYNHLLKGFKMLGPALK